MKGVAMFVASGEFWGKAALVTLFSVLAFLKIVAIKAGLATWNETDGGDKYVEVAANLASLAFLVLLLVVTIARFRPNRTAQGWEPRVSALLGSFLSFALVALPQADFGPVWRAFGVVLIGVGMALSIYVLARLGRSFSVIPQARRLVTTGPYAVVRHPLYLSEEIAMIGIVMVHFSAVAIALLAVQWMFQLRRMVNEERLLRACFIEYAAYAARTPRVIPRLYRRMDAAAGAAAAKTA